MNHFLAVHDHECTVPALDQSWADGLPAHTAQLPRLHRLIYAAASAVIARNCGPAPRSIITGTALGDLDSLQRFIDHSLTHGSDLSVEYTTAVPGALARQFTRDFALGGRNLTLSDGHNSLASALVAASLLSAGDLPALLCIADERIRLLDTLQPHLTRKCTLYHAKNWHDGAVAVLVDAPSDATRPLIRAFPPVPTQRHDPEAFCKSYIKKVYPVFSGIFHFKDSSTSLLQPALTLCECLRQKSGHAFVCSYSPTTGAAGLVEVVGAEKTAELNHQRR
jgi:hypothetical protein